MTKKSLLTFIGMGLIPVALYTFLKDVWDNYCWSSWVNSDSTWIGYGNLIFLVLLGILYVTGLFFASYKLNFTITKKNQIPVENILSVSEQIAPTVEKYKIKENKTGLGEIAIYFGERKSADPTLIEILTNSESNKVNEPLKEIVIAAIGFNTISSILEKSEVINYIAESIITYPNDFKMTVIFPKGIDDMNRIRPERETHAKKSVIDGHKNLKEFAEKLDNACRHELKGDKMKLNGFKLNTYLEFRTYEFKTMPRHFILKVNDTIFVGSYLSHQIGSNSYLLQLRKWEKTSKDEYHLGLYGLFKQEVTSLLENGNTSEITFDEFKEIVKTEEGIKIS